MLEIHLSVHNELFLEKKRLMVKNRHDDMMFVVVGKFAVVAFDGDLVFPWNSLVHQVRE